MGWQRVLSLSTARLSSEMRWAPIFEFFEMSLDRFWENFLIVWAVSECGAWTKMSFPFCILILDFISRVGNFEISSIEGCDRIRWQMFKFGDKIGACVKTSPPNFNRWFRGLYRFISRVWMTLGIELIKLLYAPQFVLMVLALFSQPLRKVGWNKSSLL